MKTATSTKRNQPKGRVAVFLAEEPAQPQGRNSKPKASALFLFERALSAKQEREKELIGAGR